MQFSDICVCYRFTVRVVVIKDWLLTMKRLRLSEGLRENKQLRSIFWR